MQSTLSPYLTLLAISLMTACVAPRAITKSGRVTPKGEVRVALAMQGNIATASAGLLLDSTLGAVDDIASGEPVSEDSFNTAAKSAVATALDYPFAFGLAVGARYGIWERVDVGVERNTGAWAFDAGYQFLGPLDGQGHVEASPIYGSVSLQISRQSYELPSEFEKIGDLLGFYMTRTDLLVPLAFSHSFGPDELYGAIAYGAAINYSMLEYGLSPHEVVLVVDGVEQAAEAVSDEKSYLSYGAFFNLKLGYRYAYALLGLAAYYQNYGRFKLPGEAEFELSGMTFVPTFGAEARF